jgi:aminopeptidase YwaD
MGLRDRLRTHVQALAGERHPFYSGLALERAKHYIHDQLRLLSLNTSFHPFDAFGTSYHNVVGILRPFADATLSALPPLILAAHYDTVQGSPGADDNASGVAVLLETARTLRDLPLSAEIRFIAFCLEEEDLLGSLAYAAHLRESNEAIRGAIVLECVGFTSSLEGSQQTPPSVPIVVPTTGDFLAIVGNTASAALVASLDEAAKARAADLKTVSLLVPGQGELLPDTRRSDHAAFWVHGYPAVMLTDTANFRNPHYHRPTDTIETLDFTFMGRLVDLLTAMAARHLS